MWHGLSIRRNDNVLSATSYYRHLSFPSLCLSAVVRHSILLCVVVPHLRPCCISSDLLSSLLCLFLFFVSSVAPPRVRFYSVRLYLIFDLVSLAYFCFCGFLMFLSSSAISHFSFCCGPHVRFCCAFLFLIFACIDSFSYSSLFLMGLQTGNSSF